MSELIQHTLCNCKKYYRENEDNLTKNLVQISLEVLEIIQELIIDVQFLETKHPCLTKM